MDTVIVLLSTYNGERFLREQIDSILNQEGIDVNLIVRDDGSKDSTLDILEEYKKEGKLKYYTGENKRTAQSFMDLIYTAPEAEFYAFSDQDDYWLPDKLRIGVEQIKKENCKTPLLYYGMPRIVDEKLNLIKSQSATCETMTTFESCLVNSKATGCTMIFNKALWHILKSTRPDYVLMHDAWAHKVCLALGGKVIFDPDVHILYRQHGNNVVGVPKNLLGKIKLYYGEFQKDDQMRSRCVRSLVESFGDQMSPDKRKEAEIVAYYSDDLVKTLRLLFNRRIKTNYWKRNIMYKSAVLFRRF